VSLDFCRKYCSYNSQLIFFLLYLLILPHSFFLLYLWRLVLSFDLFSFVTVLLLFFIFSISIMIQWCNYLSSNAIKWRKSCQYLDVRSRYLLPFNVYHKSIPVHLQIQTCLLYRWLMSFLMFDKAVILSYIILYFYKTPTVLLIVKVCKSLFELRGKNKSKQRKIM
jgi:hypothetical protein